MRQQEKKNQWNTSKELRGVSLRRQHDWQSSWSASYASALRKLQLGHQNFETNPMTGVWLLMAMGYSERTGEGEKVFALYIKKWIEGEELWLKNGNKEVKSFWVIIKTLRQHREPCGWLLLWAALSRTFLLHLQEALHLKALFLLTDFNKSDIPWKSSTVSYRQCRRLLEYIENSFLSQVIALPEGMQYWAW